MPSVYLHSLATRNPEHAYSQESAGEMLTGQLEPGGRGQRLSQRIYRHSGIDQRHSVISGYLPGQGDGVFFDGDSGDFLSPTTGTRNAKYVEAAKPLFVDTARDALEASPFSAHEVTHVITVSCTGFFAPGPDYYILRDLGLPSNTQRYHIGFMGCFAAFPALRMAASFCKNDPDAVVLIVCLELCTLHLEPSDVIDNIIACSVFADGAASVVVSAQAPDGPIALVAAGGDSTAGATAVEFVDSVTQLAPDSENDMAWKIGDRGFEMVLSTYVPKILGAQIGGIVDDLLGQSGRRREDIAHWWVHPGGRAILDHIHQGLKLDPEALAPSRRVLSRFGNMSSATILFVLQEALAGGGGPGPSGDVEAGDLAYAMAFGPGLTVESALLRGV
ncbi:MAG: putative naringenin-chalcone synthase [Rhodothermales bacterium]|jgi:predicted naringenin-chalcone synthase